MKRHGHARIVLEPVPLDVLFGRPAHQQLARCIVCLHVLLNRPIQQHAVVNNLRLQSRRAKLLRHIVGRRFVFRCCGKMRLRGQRFQVLPGQLRIGNREELTLDLRLSGEVGVAKDWPNC